GEAEDGPGELDDRALKAETETEHGDPVLPAVADGGDLAFDSPVPEPAGDDHAVEIGQIGVGQEAGYVLGGDPADVELDPVTGGGVAKGLEHGQVGVGQLDVLADDADRDHLGGGGGPFHHCPPVVQVRRAGHQAEPVADDLVEPTVVELEGHLVDVRG